MSDLDSISITSTRSSDEEAEYSVEKINAEEQDDEGVMKYLVKWEGYPVHLSTWEPAENLISAQILPNWENEKEEIASGVRAPFDLDDFWEQQEQQMEAKAERHHRRVAKRKKLGIPVSRGGSVSNGSANDVAMRDDDEESEEDEPLAARQKRVKVVTPKRKGVAQKVTRKQPAEPSSSGEESSDDENSTSEDSLMEESRSAQRTSINGHPSAARAATSRTTAQSTTSRTRSDVTPTTARNAANKVTKRVSPTQKPAAARKSAASSSSAHARTADRPILSSSARKSAPSTASVGSSNTAAPQRLPVLLTDQPKRKSTGNVSFNFKPKPGPKARRMSESDPRHQRFANLSEQNRFHKHAGKEAAPDPSMLSTFNPATGRFEQPTSTGSSSLAVTRAVAGSSTRAVPSVFGRREAPAPVRQRSVSPSSPRGPPASTVPSDNTTPYRKVCWNWRLSTCTKPEGMCTFAHHYITCPYWKEGICKFSDRDCQLDHCEGRDPIWFSHRGSGATNTSAFPPSNLRTQHPRVPQAPGMSPPQEEMPAIQKRSSVPGPLVPPPHMTKPQQPTTLYLKDIVCRDWWAGRCKWGNACKLAHRDTGHHIDFRDVTCSYWLDEGRCRLSDFECKFAHRLTEYRAGPPKSGQILFVPMDADTSNVLNAPRTAGADVQQYQLRRPNAFDDLGSDSMDIDDGSSHGVVPSPLNGTTGFKRPSLSVKRPANGTALVYDIVLALKDKDIGFEAPVKLVCFTEQDGTMLAESLASQAESQPRLEIGKGMSAVDLKRRFVDKLQQGARFPTGDVQAEGSRGDGLKALADLYGMAKSCGIVEASDFTILLYPAAAEQWKFLNSAGDTRSQAALRFKLLPPLSTKLSTEVQSVSNVVSGASEYSTDNTNRNSSSLDMKHMLDRNMERLLTVSDVKTEDKVFVMMPESRASEIQLIVGTFEERFKQPDYQGRDCKIWTSQETGSWDTCVKHTACLVIVHPDIALWDIPHLGKLLHASSFRFFSIGLDPALALLNNTTPSFRPQRLFPMGDVVFITDEVFLKTPWKVLSIIERFNKDNAHKPYGATRNKIATRPGIRRWLMDLVLQQEQGKEDPRMGMLLEEICKLCPVDKEDEQYPGNPSEQSDLVSLAPEQLPTYQTLLQTGDTASTAKATDYLVNWFAGWSFMNASKFRRFTVCHEEPGTGEKVIDKNYMWVMKGGQADPRGWGQEFKYLLVKTPDEWIEWNEAKAKVSRRR